ncbi:MAG TPA: dihydroorotase family protein [Planctomycetota bacterium]|nr:dihydroorotase family protein [Planctomycetota bacterium]
MTELAPSGDVTLAGGSVFREGRFAPAEIAISGGRIVEVAPRVTRRGEVIDVAGSAVLPGLLDVHVHFREPGLERKEGWAHGSRGALHGGVTSVLEVQNNPPLTVSLARLEEREAIVRNASRVDYGLFANLLPESAGALAELAPRTPAFKLFMGGSTGMSGVSDYGALRDLFRAAAAAGRPVVVHAEEESILARDMPRHAASAAEHHLARSVEAETVSISAAIELAAATRASLHVFHVSTGRGADQVAQARASGIDVTASTGPHYLLLTHEDVALAGNAMKCNPSVKTARDRDRLRERVADGTIAAIGTDHAPHPIEEKRRPYAEAPSGLPSVDLALPLLLAIADGAGIPFARLVDSMAEGAARCFGVGRKGCIAPGHDGDLVVVNLEAERAVRGEELPSRSRWSPYEGRTLRGYPTLVLRRGEVAFRAGAFPDLSPSERVELDPPQPR